MFDQFSASAISALLPNVIYTVPYFGIVDFQRPLSAGLVFVLLTFVFWFLRKVILHRARALASRTKGTFDDLLVDIIEGVRAWVYTLIALYASLQFFTFPPSVESVSKLVFLFVVVWQIIEALTSLVDYFATRFLEKDEDGDGKIDPNTANASHLVALIARITLWVLGTLFVLSNLGIEVTSLLAGLGIGGLAVAFALQGVLSDLFASFSIYFDKPFRIGDFIVIGTDSGTVEKIGIKSTRIRTLQGEELVISNAELTTARVQNFKKMKERRVVTKFGITYETFQELVKEVPAIVSRIFTALEGGRLDRVHFTSFGDSALIFEVVYYVESSDYTQYLNIQQGFNFDLMKQFSELGIEFAYPTQTIYTKTV
ncbi:mechanosensitive ion channel family protein [Candidatus Nomurabacteria bacterium]|nr:mechanosensitive ion channel family protein [Candidatus Kaiserbacteria bacterium]MCB9815489.1 mechanosensitive ion channel family protein [Candidatus Nomurabacteria bacterium]